MVDWLVPRCGCKSLGQQGRFGSLRTTAGLLATLPWLRTYSLPLRNPGSENLGALVLMLNVGWMYDHLHFVNINSKFWILFNESYDIHISGTTSCILTVMLKRSYLWTAVKWPRVLLLTSRLVALMRLSIASVNIAVLWCKRWPWLPTGHLNILLFYQAPASERRLYLQINHLQNGRNKCMSAL